jgi:acyl transferase domain-containing protein
VTGEVDLEDALPRVARGDWPRQSREPARFEDGLHRLVQDGVSIFVEVGASGTLIQRAREVLSDSGRPTDGSGPAPLLVSSLEPGRDDWDALLSSLAQLWCRGVAVDWEAFDAGRRRARVSLPTYPFERQRHWYTVRAPAGGPEPVTIGGPESQRRGASTSYVPPSRPEDDAEKARDDGTATAREKQIDGVANGAEGAQVLDALRQGRLSVTDAIDRLLRNPVPAPTSARDAS